MKVLRLVREKFLHVFYVPGNHEMWIQKMHEKDADEAQEREAICNDSIEKFFHIQSLCDKLGVHTLPTFVGQGPECVLVMPLFSWYNAQFGDGKASPDLEAFDLQCLWPSHVAPEERGSQQPSIETFFSSLNTCALERLAHWREQELQFTTLSLSHFIPFPEVFPGFKQLRCVMGSPQLGSQVTTCRSSVHVFGHSHISVDELVADPAGHVIRMVQAAIGYAKEHGETLVSQEESLAKASPVMLWRPKLPKQKSSKRVRSLTML